LEAGGWCLQRYSESLSHPFNFSHQSGNSIFLSHHSSSSLQLQCAERSHTVHFAFQQESPISKLPAKHVRSDISAARAHLGTTVRLLTVSAETRADQPRHRRPTWRP